MEKLTAFALTAGVVALVSSSSLLAKYSSAATPEVKLSSMEVPSAWEVANRRVEEMVVTPTVNLALLDEAIEKSYADAVADLERNRP